jgi:hypothetical protein
VDRFLSKLERKVGWLCIPYLSWVITGGLLLVFLVSIVKPEITEKLRLDVDAVGNGEVWRLFTYAFIPFKMSRVFWVFNILFVYWFSRGLEGEWGSFKFNLYYFFGLILTTSTAVLLDRFYVPGVAHILNAEFLHLSLFLGYATLNPDLPVTFMFVLPVRLKWLAIFDVGYMVYLCTMIPTAAPWILAGVALVNYLVFFSSHILAFVRGQALISKQAVRRASARASSPPAGGGIGSRTCAICGAKETEGADIRVCSCEKCGGAARNLCLQHARNH